MIKPRQKISYAEKMANNCEWGKENLRYYSNATSTPYDAKSSMEFLKIAAGKISEIDYTYVTNPMNLKTKDGKERKYPARLRNFDIISPIFMQMLAEKASRWTGPIVYSRNTDLDSLEQQFDLQEIEQSLHDEFKNIMIKNNLWTWQEGQTDEQGNPIPEPEHPEQAKMRKRSVKDMRTERGQRAIEYIIAEQEVPEKMRKMFQYFLATTMCVCYTEVRNDNVYYHFVPNGRFTYYDSGNKKYIEDMEAQRFEIDASVSEVIDMFFEFPDFDDDIINALEHKYSTMGNVSMSFTDIFKKNFLGEQSAGSATVHTVRVEHIQWTSMREAMRVQVQDGKKVRWEIVDEDYIPTEYDVIEKKWINQKWEGWIIDGQHYIGCQPVKIQRTKFSNPNDCKSNYNGTIFMKGEINQLSMAEKLKFYQESYNVVKYKLHETINKNRGKLGLIPRGMVNGDEDGDWDFFTTMYYADVLNFLFYDETVENVEVLLQGIKAIDLSLGEYIKQLFDIAQGIKQEAEELVGFNKYRTMNVGTNEAVSNVQQGQYTSALVTELYFREFEELENRIYQGFIDYSKYAFINGKRAAYIYTDGERRMLDIMDGDDYADTEYGIFVQSSGEMKQAYEQMKQLALTLAQNGMPGSYIAQIFNNCGNMPMIIDKLKEMEDEINARNQATQQAEMDMVKMQQDREDQRFTAEMNFKYKELNDQLAVKLRDIALKYASDGEGDGGSSVDMIRLNADIQKMLADIGLKRQELSLNMFKTVADNQTKLQVSKDNKTIARTNPG